MKTKQLLQAFLKEPNLANFTKIKDNYLLLSLAYDALENKEQLTQFFVSFEDWYAVYVGAYAYDLTASSLKSVAFAALNSFDFSLEEWYAKYNAVSNEFVEDLIHKKISAFTLSFEEWCALRDTSYRGLNAIVDAKMLSTAKTIDHWICLSNRSAHLPVAIQKLAAFKKPAKYWRILSYQNHSCSELKELCLEKVVSLTKSLSDLHFVYKEIRSYSKYGDLQESVRQSIFNFQGGSLKDWYAIFICFSELQLHAIQKMDGILGTFDQWSEIYLSSSDSSLKQLAYGKMQGFIQK